MRTIKFRAYAKPLGQMITEASGHFDYRNPPDGWELMQFTGLLDKNEEEIYEGDILHFTSLNGLIYGHDLTLEVFWEDKIGGFHLRMQRNVDRGASENFWYAPQGEVIGNIYENPELLAQNK